MWMFLLVFQDPVDEALAQAKKHHSRVLLAQGLAENLQKDLYVRAKLRADYEVVWSKSDEARLKVLAADGSIVADQSAKDFDAKTFIKFLDQHEGPRRPAKDLLDEAVARAKDGKKRVMLTFGSPG